MGGIKPYLLAGSRAIGEGIVDGPNGEKKELSLFKGKYRWPLALVFAGFHICNYSLFFTLSLAGLNYQDPSIRRDIIV